MKRSTPKQDAKIAAVVIAAAIAWPVAGGLFGFDPGQTLFNLVLGALLWAMIGTLALFILAFLFGGRR